MFKKPVNVETKSEKQVGGKDLKTLKKQLEERWGEQPFLGALTKQVSWRKNRSSAFLMNEDGACILFNSEGFDGNLPSLDTLWNFPSNLPTIVIHPPVSEFICKGADLMFPGVRKPYPEIPKGAIVQIKIAGNPSPIAIGITLEEAAHWNSLTTRSGMCVQVLIPIVRILLHVGAPSGRTEFYKRSRHKEYALSRLHYEEPCATHS